MPGEPSFMVTCLQRVEQVASEFGATHVFSFLDPSIDPSHHPRFPPIIKNIKYTFFDQEEGAHVAEVESAVKQLIYDVSPLINTEARILFHCHAGASRSPAACLIAIAMQKGPSNEQKAFQKLLAITKKPWPNLRMVSTADSILGRNGAITELVSAYQNTNANRLIIYRRLNRRRGIHSPVQRFERSKA